MFDEHSYRALVESGLTQEALEMLSRAIEADPADSRALFERGKLHWRLGLRAEATADYAAAAAIDGPESSAAIALQHADDIAAFFNPDLYNP